MKTFLPKRFFTRTLLMGLVFLLLGLSESFGQVFDGNYEYDDLLGIQSDTIDASASGTCEVNTIWATLLPTNDSLLIGVRNGNNGNAIFRFYIDTDQNAETGLKSDEFKNVNYPVGGAELIVQINVADGTILVYDSLLNLDDTTGIQGAIGNYSGIDGEFFEMLLPLNIFDICNPSSNGVINLAYYISFSGGSLTSAPCDTATINFEIGLGGEVLADQTICSGEFADTLKLSGQKGSVIRWEKSTDPSFSSPITIIKDTTFLLPEDIGVLTDTTYFRALVAGAEGICDDALELKSKPVVINITELPVCQILGISGSVCPGSSDKFIAPIGVDSVLWSVTGNVIFNGNKTNDTIYVDAGIICDSSYTISLTIWENGCSSTCDSVINVIDSTAPVGTAPAGVSGVDLCAADAISTYTFNAATVAGNYSDNCLG
ncbi:hypothetical protein OU798_18425, partial [Prolixibacteraceae bacterium Z1-6]|nr:hypothetical protein [Prolixibacteraceae bacterium Z1-6]